MVFNFKTCTLSKEIHDDHVTLGLKIMVFNYVTVSILSDLKYPIQWKKTKTIVKRNTIQNRSTRQQNKLFQVSVINIVYVT